MARYIDADLFLQELAIYENYFDNCQDWSARNTILQIRAELKEAPTADVVEVKHGKWIHEPPYKAPNGQYLKASECSNCHAFFVSNGNEPYSDHPYCCECGAKMDK